MYLVISTSLNPNSRSRVLAQAMYERLASLGQPVELVDLQEVPLPLCDANHCYADANVQQVAAQIEQARGIIVATPIYNYDVSAAAKNLIELTGKAWAQKVVGFVCAAGGKVSYMSVMGISNSLMLDFRSLILPNFVFATGGAFDEAGQITDEKIDQRLTRLAQTLVRVAEALHPPAGSP